MNKELQEKLFNKYPVLFRQKDLPKSETCMCWGIATGDGWFDLIDQVCSFIQFHLDKNSRWYPPIEFVQVKEKFGGLRMYIETKVMSEEEYKQSDKTKWFKDYNDYMVVMDRGDCTFRGAISLAENLSFTICEQCGAKATKTTAGWIRRLCDECFKKGGYKEGKEMKRVTLKTSDGGFEQVKSDGQT